MKYSKTFLSEQIGFAEIDLLEISLAFNIFDINVDSRCSSNFEISGDFFKYLNIQFSAVTWVSVFFRGLNR